MNCNRELNVEQCDNNIVSEYGLFLVDKLFISKQWKREVKKDTDNVTIRYFKNYLDEFLINIKNNEVNVLVPIKNSNSSYKTTFYKKKDSMFSVSEYLEMHLHEFETE